MSRQLADRRRRPTRPWDFLTTPGRRSTLRRSDRGDASRFRFVDRYSPRTGVLVVLVLLFTLTDGVLTLLLLDHSCEEANPLMAYLVERGPLWFLGGKYLLTAVGLAVFVVLKYYRLFGTRFRLGYFIPILAGLYIVLLIYQVLLFKEVERVHQGRNLGARQAGPIRGGGDPPPRPLPRSGRTTGGVVE
jgi:hypothetical protein